MDPRRQQRLLWAAVGVAVVAVVALTGLLLWGGPATPTPTPTPTTVTSARSRSTVALRQGEPAEAGHYYAVRLEGFTPGTAVPVVCRDSVSPDGFKTFTMSVGIDGTATAGRGCFSGDGPDHWVTTAGLTSNMVMWGAGTASQSATGPSRSATSKPATTQVPVTDPPRTATARSVRLTKGGPATAGYWYDVRLEGFAPDSAVELVCRDGVDPGGFKTFSVRTDGGGGVRVAQACYSGDGHEHWITADGVVSNKVAW